MKSDAVNRERINDRGKLIFHRLVARRLKYSPELIETARAYVSERHRTGDGRYVALSEWSDMVAGDVDSLRRRLVARGTEMNRLRLSSPFAVMAEFTIEDESARRKLWRIAKKGLVPAR